MKKLMKRGLALALAVISVLTLMTACGGGEEQSGEQGSTAKKYINVSTTAPQTTCNPYTSQAATDNTVVGYVTDGLYGIIPDEVTKKGARVPIYAAAEPVDVNGDGTMFSLNGLAQIPYTGQVNFFMNNNVQKLYDAAAARMEEMKAAGISMGQLRFSIGVESAEDIIAELEAALAKV